MITRAKTPQLHLLRILDLLRVAVAPLHRHLGVGIRVHEDVERAVALELREEGDRGCDLAEDGLDFVLDFLLCLLGRRVGGSICLLACYTSRRISSVGLRESLLGCCVLLVGGFFRRA